MNDRLIIRAGVIATVLFVGMGLVDGFIAVQLREISSWIAYSILDLASFPIEKVGTLLKTPRMNFDVVPACSGSTTLRVMIFVGIVWTAMQDKMSLARKACLFTVVIPLALISNGIRISILVLVGYSMYKPVEGILHDLTGMVTFTLAFGGLLIATQLFMRGRFEKENTSRIGVHIAAFISVFILVYSKFFFWCLTGWSSSPLDHYGFLFVIFGLIGVSYSCWRAGSVVDNFVLTSLIATSSCIVFIVASVVDINILLGVSFILFVLAVLCSVGGTSRMVYSLPFVGVMALGIPTVTFVINKVMITLGMSGSKSGIMVKVIIAALLASIGVWRLLIRNKSTNRFVLPVRQLDWLAGALVLMLVVTMYYNSEETSNTHPGELKVSYILGDWVGRKSMDFQMNPDISYQDSWLRSYSNGTHNVSMTVTASGGDRHQLHPPEYCLTGGGWTLNNEQKIPYTFLEGVNGEVTEMLLDKHESGSYFVYWFTDGKSVFPNYRSMLAEDTLRRLTNVQTKWFLFRFVAPSKKIMLNDFLPKLTGEMEIDDKIYTF